jgi:hypothetical protein
MAALRTYENGKVTAPDAHAATAYMLAAEQAGRSDLVQVFGSALYRAMGIEQFGDAPRLAKWILLRRQNLTSFVPSALI